MLDLIDMLLDIIAVSIVIPFFATSWLERAPWRELTLVVLCRASLKPFAGSEGRVWRF